MYEESSSITSRVDNTRVLPPNSFAITWEVLASTASSVNIIFVFNDFAKLITLSSLLDVGSPWGSTESIIECWFRSYSFAKYENALWNAIKSFLQEDRFFRISSSSKSNSNL